MTPDPFPKRPVVWANYGGRWPTLWIYNTSNTVRVPRA